MSIPDEFIDPETGRRVVHISRHGGESASWYFHNYPFLHDLGDGQGDKLVYRGRTDKGWQLFTANLKTLEIQQLTDFTHDDRRLTEVLGKTRREAYYRDGRSLSAIHLDSGETRTVAELPEHFAGAPATINADETKLCGAGPKAKSPFTKNLEATGSPPFSRRIYPTISTVSTSSLVRSMNSSVTPTG